MWTRSISARSKWPRERTEPRTSFRIRRSRRFELLLLGACLLGSALLGVLLGACAQPDAYRPVSSELLHQRSALLLQEPPSQQTIYQKWLQQRLRRSLVERVFFASLLTSLDMRKRGYAEPALEDAYHRYAGSLAVLGISDPQIALELHEATGVSLLVLGQAVHEPCPSCPEGDLLAVVFTLVDAQSGDIHYRQRHATRIPPSDEPEAERSAAAEREATEERLETLLDALLQDVEQVTSPVWHRTRFQWLAVDPP